MHRSQEGGTPERPLDKNVVENGFVFLWVHTLGAHSRISEAVHEM